MLSSIFINLDLVVPVYNESKIVKLFFKEINNTFTLKKIQINKIKKINLIFVDDGSTDETLSLIKKESEFLSNFISVSIIKFSRNFGHSSAVWAGLKNSKGDAVVVMDFDLQDPPKIIYSFLKMYRKGYKIINGIRKNRKENFLKKIIFYLFYRTYYLLSDIKIETDCGDFSLIDKKVLKEILLLSDNNKIYRFVRMWIGYKSAKVEYERAERSGGESKYSLSKYLDLAVNNIFNSSTKMFKLSQFFLFFFLTVLVTLSLYTILKYKHYQDLSLLEYNFENETRLWFLALILIICFFSFCQTLILVVMNSYFKRLYIKVQDRPIFVVEKKINVKK